MLKDGKTFCNMSDCHRVLFLENKGAQVSLNQTEGVVKGDLRRLIRSRGRKRRPNERPRFRGAVPSLDQDSQKSVLKRSSDTKRVPVFIPVGVFSSRPATTKVECHPTHIPFSPVSQSHIIINFL